MRIAYSHARLLLTPRKVDVQVTAFGVAWAPFWQMQAQPGRLDWVPAYR